MANEAPLRTITMERHSLKVVVEESCNHIFWLELHQQMNDAGSTIVMTLICRDWDSAFVAGTALIHARRNPLV